MQTQWDSFSQMPSMSGKAGSDRAYLQLLIEHSPIAIVILNSSHQAERCNPTFERMFGYTRAEIVDRNFDELIACEDALEEARQCTLSVLHGEKVRFATRRRRKDGVLIDVDIHGIPLIVDGVLRGVYGLYVDITERTRAESALRHLSLELMHSQEKEKRRIARELHDATSQELALLSMSLGRLQRKLPPGDRELRELMSNIKDLAQQCTQKIRSASYLLHPPLLEEAGLIPAISWLAEGFAKRSDIRVNVKISSRLGRLTEMAELTIFRVVQESLSNVIRHSTSSEVNIRLSRFQHNIRLSITNRGAVVSSGRSDDILRHDGVGISGMRERLQELGGHLDVHAVTNGMVVIASLPAEERASAQTANCSSR
jgi:two-component system, NarL family, sensor kinase